MFKPHHMTAPPSGPWLSKIKYIDRVVLFGSFDLKKKKNPLYEVLWSRLFDYEFSLVFRRESDVQEVEERGRIQSRSRPRPSVSKPRAVSISRSRLVH